jgi:hypothetical protein
MVLVMLGRWTLVPESTPIEVETPIENLNRYKSPGIDQILAELIQAEGEILHSGIHKLINCIWNKEELPEQCCTNLQEDR